MENYTICQDIYEIFSGSNNSMSPEYMEAADNLNNGKSTGIMQLKKFFATTEKLADSSQVKDKRISDSRGNIRSFSGFNDIKDSIDFLNKHLYGIKDVQSCSKMLDLLIKYQPNYTEAYDKKVKLLILEYENAVYMLVTNLSMIMSSNMDVVANGSEIRIQKKTAKTFGVINKTFEDLLKIVGERNHGSYMEALLKEEGKDPKITPVGEAVYTEGTIGDSMEFFNLITGAAIATKRFGLTLFKVIKKSIFGIVPIIRSIVFIRYKKKADTILALEQQMGFVRQNIEQLENRSNIDPEKKAAIIKKQQAVIERYKKKSEKLRAQLCEQEKDASTEIKKTDKDSGNYKPETEPANNDNADDMVLEFVESLSNLDNEDYNDETPILDC